jgi:hypothetical protein
VEKWTVDNSNRKYSTPSIIMEYYCVYESAVFKKEDHLGVTYLLSGEFSASLLLFLWLLHFFLLFTRRNSPVKGVANLTQNTQTRAHIHLPQHILLTHTNTNTHTIHISWFFFHSCSVQVVKEIAKFYKYYKYILYT